MSFQSFTSQINEVTKTRDSVYYRPSDVIEAIKLLFNILSYYDFLPNDVSDIIVKNFRLGSCLRLIGPDIMRIGPYFMRRPLRNSGLPMCENSYVVLWDTYVYYELEPTLSGDDDAYEYYHPSWKRVKQNSNFYYEEEILLQLVAIKTKSGIRIGDITEDSNWEQAAATWGHRTGLSFAGTRCKLLKERTRRLERKNNIMYSFAKWTADSEDFCGCKKAAAVVKANRAKERHTRREKSQARSKVRSKKKTRQSS